MKAPLLLALGVASLLLPGGPGAAQGILLDARVRVTLPSPGEPIQVHATYKVLPQAGTVEIPLSVLAPEPTSIRSVRAFLAGDASEPEWEEAPAGIEEEVPALHLEEVRDFFSEGFIQLAASVEESDDPLFLHLFYAVEGAWNQGGRATLPLLVPRWVPGEPTPRTFLAQVEVPEGYTLIQMFPTSVLDRPPPGKAGRYEIGLQGVPAMLAFRVVAGEGPRITLERGLDIFVVLILFIMGGFGVRYLRGREV